MADRCKLFFQAFLEGFNDGGQVAPGPEDPPAAGALEELVVVMEDVLRHPTLDPLPGNRDEPVVAAAAPAQRLDLPGGNFQMAQHLLELGLR